MSEPLRILHRPHGTDHPYLADADERTPRDPVGGDMVSVGFLTTPGGAAEHVRLEWARNGRPQTPIHGRALARGHDADRWLVELGVLEASDCVEYSMVAEGRSARASYPRTSFGVRRLRRLAAVGAAEPSPAGLRVGTWGEDGLPGPTLHIERLPVAHALRVSLEPAAAAGGRAAEPVTFAAGDARLMVAPDGRITLVAGGATVPLRLRWVEEADGRLAALELSGALDEDEAIVGMGERFDALNQRGRAPGVAVYEQYKNQGDRTYLPVPFFVSSRGFALLVEGSAPVDCDFGRTLPDRWRCHAQAESGGHLAVDLFAGKPAACVRALVELTGKPLAPPPAWAFGLWMSSNEWNTQARVEHEVAQTQAHAIPATALVIEAWSDETTFYIWNGACYTPRAGDWRPQLADFTFPADGPWPDPQAMAQQLRAAGIHLLLWQIPALKQAEAFHAQHEADTAHALDAGYVLRLEDGTPYRNPAFWFNGALIPDFTSAAATAWWMQKRAYLLDEMGVDGFKTDGGEHLQGRALVAADGRRGRELVNAYPTLYVGAYHRFARAHRGDEAMTFSRAGHTGVGAFPAHWAGDENSTWEAFRRSLVAGLSAGLSGIPFWGWDIAGFSEALPSAELYLRGTAMAAFCPIMQYHSEYSAPHEASKDRTPWHIAERSGDARVLPIFRFFARLRMNLLPWLQREAAHSAATGEPMLRALLLDAPDDPAVWAIADQYMLGRDLLVAPVLDEGAQQRRLYLPVGDWYALWSGERLSGGRWIEVDAPLERIPIYVRAGAVLSLHLGAPGELGSDVGNALEPAELTLAVYPGAAERSSFGLRGAVYEVAVEPHAGGTRVHLPALPIACRLRLPDGRLLPAADSSHAQTIVV